MFAFKMKQVEIQINTPEEKLPQLVYRLRRMNFWVRFLIIGYLSVVIMGDILDYVNFFSVNKT